MLIKLQKVLRSLPQNSSETVESEPEIPKIVYIPPEKKGKLLMI